MALGDWEHFEENATAECAMCYVCPPDRKIGLLPSLCIETILSNNQPVFYINAFT